jgi:hypothetical protein
MVLLQVHLILIPNFFTYLYLAFLVLASKVAANITSYISSDSDVGLPNFNANASFVDINQPIRFTPESNLHEPKFGITAASVDINSSIPIKTILEKTSINDHFSSFYSEETQTRDHFSEIFL